jgi:hypothetical protein
MEGPAKDFDDPLNEKTCATIVQLLVDEVGRYEPGQREPRGGAEGQWRR